MAILPVVGLEQVILQSPALAGEPAKDRHNAGTPVPPAVSGPDEPLMPVTQVGRVSPVGPEMETGPGVEKEDDSEYPAGGRREKGGKKRSGTGRTGPPGRRLDIKA